MEEPEQKYPAMKTTPLGAIEFTPANGIVTLSAHLTQMGIELTVVDSGIGMSAADIELALAPFGQVDSALNRDHTGTGLGLPLSKSLAELHAGTLEVESNPGKGTIVTLFLPLARKDAAYPTLQLVISGQDG